MTPPNAKATRHPLLAAGSWDYVGARYDPEPVSAGEHTFLIDHQVELDSSEAKGNLVQRLVAERKAFYACEIVSPRTVYRKLEVLRSGSRQELKISTDEVGIDKSYIRPMVISGEDMRLEVREEDGLHPIFENRLFDLQEGTILAKGRFFNMSTTAGTLLSLNVDHTLKKGRYALAVDSEDGLVFQINLAPNLHKAYHNLSAEVRGVFLTGIFANVLDQIGRACSDSDSWLEDYPNMKKLLNHLGEKKEDYEDVLKRIQGGESARLASEFRPITMPSSDDE